LRGGGRGERVERGLGSSQAGPWKENEEQVATPVERGGEVDFGNVVRDEENQGGKDGGAKGPNQCEDKC